MDYNEMLRTWWQEPLQYCKVISLQVIKINGKKKKEPEAKGSSGNGREKHQGGKRSQTWKQNVWIFQEIQARTLKRMLVLWRESIKVRSHILSLWCHCALFIYTNKWAKKYILILMGLLSAGVTWRVHILRKSRAPLVRQLRPLWV